MHLHDVESRISLLPHVQYPIVHDPWPQLSLIDRAWTLLTLFRAGILSIG